MRIDWVIPVMELEQSRFPQVIVRGVVNQLRMWLQVENTEHATFVRAWGPLLIFTLEKL